MMNRLITTVTHVYNCHEDTMCFVLQAGTSKPMLRKEWRNDAPDLYGRSGLERNAESKRAAPATAHCALNTA